MKNITSLDCMNAGTALFVASSIFGYGIIKKFPKIGAIGYIGTYAAGAVCVLAGFVISMKDFKEFYINSPKS